jgi:hypothetical protein
LDKTAARRDTDFIPYIPPHLRYPSSSLATISLSSLEPPGGCPGETTKPPGGCPGKTTPPEEYLAPWEKIWPLESTAYIRVTPRPDSELEDDESVSCYTYIYEDRVVHIWEASEYEYPEQEEEDEIARAKIIWERLNLHPIGSIATPMAPELEKARQSRIMRTSSSVSEMKLTPSGGTRLKYSPQHHQHIGSKMKKNQFLKSHSL